MLYLVGTGCSDTVRDDVAEFIAQSWTESWRAFDNAWVIECNETAMEVRRLIEARLSNGDTLLVALLAGHAVWRGFDNESVDWLLARL